MVELPTYKQGDYLECGEGKQYSKILILDNNKILIKEGDGQGAIITLQDWLYIIGENEATIQNTSYFDDCKGCPYYMSNTVKCDSIHKVHGNIESIGKESNLVNILSNGNVDMNDELTSVSSSASASASASASLPIKGILKRTQSIDSIQSIQSQNSFEKRSVSYGEVEIRTVKPRKKLPWHYRIFLCGMSDD